MGLSSKSSKSSNRPIFETEIKNAAGQVTNAFNAQQPKITGITDQLGTLVPGLMETFQNGDPNVNAARGYNADVLSGKYLGANPYIDDVITNTGNDVRNQATASLGTRGLVGGSAQSDIVSRNVGNMAGTMRLADYNTERGRMDGAVGSAAGLSAASQIPLASLMSILQAQGMPVQTAAGAGSAVGGLLGQYQNKKETYSPSLMDSIGQAINIGSTIAGFFPGKGG